MHSFRPPRLGAELHAIEDDKWGGKFSSKERIWLLDKAPGLRVASYDILCHDIM